MNNVERNLVASSIAANLGWMSAWLSDLDEHDANVDYHRACLVTESVTATLAFIESDGLSHTMWFWYPATMKGLPVNEQVIKLLEIRQAEDREMMALLNNPGIDFDIFDISDEDAHNSLIRRMQAAGNPIFGREYISPVEASDDWMDEMDEHGSWGDIDNQDLIEHYINICRDGNCDGECHY